MNAQFIRRFKSLVTVLTYRDGDYKYICTCYQIPIDIKKGGKKEEKKRLVVIVKGFQTFRKLKCVV